MAIEIGQHEIRGNLTVEHRCISCGYVESGPSTPTAALRTSRLEAIERLRQQRAQGFRVPLRYDDDPVEVADVDA